MSQENTDLTPMMRQYHAIKQEYPEALLLFRLGDFYELFFEDAVTASRELEITLTARNKERDNPVPMCGVPYHAADNYIARLLRKGYKVAICDQTEVPKKASSSSGAKSHALLRRNCHRHQRPLSRTKQFPAGGERQRRQLGCAFLDISTGEFRVHNSPATALGAVAARCRTFRPA